MKLAKDYLGTFNIKLNPDGHKSLMTYILYTFGEASSLKFDPDNNEVEIDIYSLKLKIDPVKAKEWIENHDAVKSAEIVPIQ